jgi:hypothetical protein
MSRKEYYQEHKKKELSYGDKWRKDNPDYWKDWRKSHPKYSKEHYQKVKLAYLIK